MLGDLDFAKLHYLIDEEGQPSMLYSDRSFFLGRGEGNNIVVNDPRASRRHAEIYFDGQDFVLSDLQSSNGTYLNGERIDTERLVDGDRIEIGLKSYTFRTVENQRQLDRVTQEVTRERRHSETQQVSSLLSKKGLTDQNDFSGTLATVGIADLMQLLNLAKRAGLLMVQASQGRAQVYFAGGEPVQASYAGLNGDEAVMALLQESQKGHFTFRGEQRALEPNVNSRLAHLLLEAARRSDESGG
jgi:hypothetical protein